MNASENTGFEEQPQEALALPIDNDNDPSFLSESSPSSEEDFQPPHEDHREDETGEAEPVQHGLDGHPDKKKESKETHTPQFEAFYKEFQEQPDYDLKLQMAVDFMESSLAQGGAPHFRSFWEARRLCLPLFKENISAALRGQLWNRYSDLSKEARRLKEILDEQSAFAVEQIEIAIQALETEISQYDEQVQKAVLPDDLPFPHALKNHLSLYQSLQKQLNVLNVQASRINGLRKELLKTEMRVRQKNKFFQRLSSAGDSVFPKRKELIKEVSHLFGEDINQFIQAHFEESHSQDSLYILREEIKALQSLAKVLTLNTHSFTQTRARLSECWDKIKVEEKERKKERAQKKVVYKENAGHILHHVEELKKFILGESYSIDEGQKKLNEISSLMRETEMGRDELKFLRDEVGEARKLIQAKQKSEEDSRHHQEQERTRQKRERYIQLRELAGKLVNQDDSYEVDQLLADRDQLMAQMQESSLTKNEKTEIERILKPLKDIITEKKEKALLDLSDDDKQALQQLKTVLNQRNERRLEIKKQLEILRKGAGSSSLDFEKAMNLTTQIGEEKERLEKANLGIAEIEKKIQDLQSKMKSK